MASTGSILRLHGDSTAPSARGEASVRRVWVIDNYDSFSENLVHLLSQLGADVCVVRNDAVTVADVLASRPRGVVVSPGPLTPREAGISVALIRACGRVSPPIPVLGVCLGAQALGVAYGARVGRAEEPVHGRSTPIHHGGEGVLAGLPSPFLAARYHSLVVLPTRLPACLRVTARSDAGPGSKPARGTGDVMALRHVSLPAEGVQFHPESFLTPLGPRILARFLEGCGVPGARRRTVVR